MDALTLSTLLATCAPQVHPATGAALVAVESGGNPHAIGVVGGTLVRQPVSRSDAIATAHALVADGWSFSVGLGQINLRNFTRLGLTIETAFDPCTNLTAMQVVLGECFEASPSHHGNARRVRNALSCYYSGNFSTGYRHGYVRKVVLALRTVPTLPGAKERS